MYISNDKYWVDCKMYIFKLMCVLTWTVVLCALTWYKLSWDLSWHYILFKTTFTPIWGSFPGQSGKPSGTIFFVSILLFKLIYYSEEALVLAAGSSGSQGFCLAEYAPLTFVLWTRWASCQVGSVQCLCSSGFLSCEASTEESRLTVGNESKTREPLGQQSAPWEAIVKGLQQFKLLPVACVFWC